MSKSVISPKITKEDLGLLIGIWKGDGIGSFPTIESFRFRDELEFEFINEEGVIHYKQKTWIKGEVSTPSHWESGFIRINENGVIEISNSQNGGRVEVLAGNIIESDRDRKRLEINFKSIFLGNDPRLVNTSRNIIVENDVLGYSIHMSTKTVQTANCHIEAALTRI